MSNRQCPTWNQQWNIDDKPNTVFHDRALREFRSACTDRPDIERHRYSFPNPRGWLRSVHRAENPSGTTLAAGTENGDMNGVHLRAKS